MTAFTDELHEVFALFGAIVSKRMFSGHGIYRDGLMFALVYDNALYLKADADILGHFQEQGLSPFMYTRQGRTMATSYYLAPADIMEDRELAAAWARRSFEAALRAQAARVKPGKGTAMATTKRKAAARKNVGKAAAAAKRKKTIKRLPAKTRTALGKEGAKAAKKKKSSTRVRRRH